MLNKILTSLVLSLSFMGFTTYGSAAGEILLSQRAQDETGRYVIEFPSDWEITNGKDIGVDLVARAPTTASGKDFTENANIISQKLDSTMSPRDYFESGLSELKKLDGFKLGNIKNVTLDNLDAVQAEYSYMLKGMEIKVLQYVVIKDRYALIITFGGDTTDYETTKPLFLDIVSTVQLN